MVGELQLLRSSVVVKSALDEDLDVAEEILIDVVVSILEARWLLGELLTYVLCLPLLLRLDDYISFKPRCNIL